MAVKYEWSYTTPGFITAPSGQRVSTYEKGRFRFTGGRLYHTTNGDGWAQVPCPSAETVEEVVDFLSTWGYALALQD